MMEDLTIQDRSNCRWLNKQFAVGNKYWLCNGLLKPCDIYICNNCSEYSPKTYED